MTTCVLRAMGIVAVAGLLAGLVTATAGSAAAASCPTVASDGTVTPPPAPGVDWSNCQLDQANLAGANLTGADLSKALLYSANLAGANLTDANVSGAIFNEADMTGAKVTGADMTAAVMGYVVTGAIVGQPAAGEFPSNFEVVAGFFVGPTAILTSANFAGDDLSTADLNNVTSGGVTGPVELPPNWSLVDGYLIGPTSFLNGADLAGADLAGADLDNANLALATLTGADLAGANLADTTIFGSDLTNATLTDANLTHVYGQGTTLTGADLSGATLANDLLENDNFSDANFSDADLTGVPSSDKGLFSNSDFANASFANADLSDVALGGTNLTGVSFLGATLTGVSSGDITGVPTGLPANWELRAGYLVGPTADLSFGSAVGADFAGVDLAGADLVQTNLTSASLAGTNLSGADIALSNFTNATLAGATVTGMKFTINTWSDTICPDGSNSNSDSQGCLGTPPSAKPTVTRGSAGLHGWYTSAVTIAWHWAGNGTAITGDCPASATTNGSGNPVRLHASCTNMAGDLGEASYAVKVDLTRPAVQVTGVRNGGRYVLGHVPVAGCRTTESVSGVATRAHVTITTTGSRGLGTFIATCAGAVSNAGTRQARPVRVSYTVIR